MLLIRDFQFWSVDERVVWSKEGETEAEKESEADGGS